MLAVDPTRRLENAAPSFETAIVACPADAPSLREAIGRNVNAAKFCALAISACFQPIRACSRDISRCVIWISSVRHANHTRAIGTDTSISGFSLRLSANT
jgi:hypothetical protein